MNDNPVLFVTFVLVMFLMVAGLIGLAIGFWIAHGETTIESYKDCITQKIPPKICNLIYPPLDIQNINWTAGIPFP